MNYHGVFSKRVRMKGFRGGANWDSPLGERHCGGPGEPRGQLRSQGLGTARRSLPGNENNETIKTDPNTSE
jgi:hypothetical protein